MGHIQSSFWSRMSSSSGRRWFSYLASRAAILSPSISLSSSGPERSAGEPWCIRESSEMVSMPPGAMAGAGSLGTGFLFAALAAASLALDVKSATRAAVRSALRAARVASSSEMPCMSSLAVSEWLPSRSAADLPLWSSTWIESGYDSTKNFKVAWLFCAVWTIAPQCSGIRPSALDTLVPSGNAATSSLITPSGALMLTAWCSGRPNSTLTCVAIAGAAATTSFTSWTSGRSDAR